MPGRKDFGILRSSFYADDRAQDAAEKYAALGFASSDFAFAAVAGHVVQLGLWAMRETDDGVLPGDGVAAFHDATRMPRTACRDAIAALTESGLLRPVDDGLYLVGFVECYEPIVGRRIEQAKRKREQRERETVTPTSPHVTETSPHVTPTGHADVTPTSEDVTPTSPGRLASTGSAVTPTSPHVTPSRARASVPYRAVPALPTEPTPAVPSAPQTNGHDTAGGSASPLPLNGNVAARGGEPQSIADVLKASPLPEPLGAGEIAGVLAACGAIIGRKDVDPDARRVARAVDADVRAKTADATKVRDWVNRVVWGRDYARVAYTTAMKGAR